MKDKGFMRGVIVPLLFVGIVVFILYNTNFSFSFSGHDVIKPLWEKLTDKAIGLTTSIVKI